MLILNIILLYNIYIIYYHICESRIELMGAFPISIEFFIFIQDIYNVTSLNLLLFNHFSYLNL